MALECAMPADELLKGYRVVVHIHNEKLEALHSVAEVLDSVHANIKVRPDLISSNPTLTDNKLEGEYSDASLLPILGVCEV